MRRGLALVYLCYPIKLEKTPKNIFDYMLTGVIFLIGYLLLILSLFTGILSLP